jgi:hypothetical protein
VDAQDRAWLHRAAHVRTAAAVANVRAGGAVVMQRAAPPITGVVVGRVVLGSRQSTAQPSGGGRGRRAGGGMQANPRTSLRWVDGGSPRPGRSWQRRGRARGVTTAARPGRQA